MFLYNFLRFNKSSQRRYEMKKNLFLALFAFGFTALTGIFSSCSSESRTSSINVPVESIFKSIGLTARTAETSTDSYELKISVNAGSQTVATETIPWNQTAQTATCTFENITTGITIKLTAEVTENEHTIFKGSSEETTIQEGENNISIKLKQLLSSITVKTALEEIADYDITLNLENESESYTYNPTGKELLAGYEIKYLPIGNISITAEAKSDGTTIYRGTLKSTVEKEQKSIVLEMKKVESDATAEIRKLPDNINLETSFSSSDSTIQLSQETATFHIYYLGENDKKSLPDWVTYSWKLNETPFETDGTNAEFYATTGILTIYLNKIPSLLLAQQNQLVVELGCEDSSEVKAASVNFTVTK